MEKRRTVAEPTEFQDGMFKGSNGKWYYYNHPHEIIAPNVMRFAEIRHWIREFMNNPEYGWTAKGGWPALNRALGFDKKDMIKFKMNGTWIWPTEQYKLTARINDILKGYIVPMRINGNQMEGSWRDPPEPPKISGKSGIEFVATIHGLKRAPPKTLMHSSASMPSFSTVFSRVNNYPDARFKNKKPRTSRG